MASMVIIAVPVVAIVFHFVVVAVLGCSAVEQVVIIEVDRSVRYY